MKHARKMLLAALIGLSAGVSLAQPGGGMGAGQGAGPMSAGTAASGANAGPGGGMGSGGGRRAMRAGSDNTPGWALMTQQERVQHRQQMRAMKTYEECKAYVAQHHEMMLARSKERGGKVLPMPRRDPCAGLKK